MFSKSPKSLLLRAVQKKMRMRALSKKSQRVKWPLFKKSGRRWTRCSRSIRTPSHCSSLTWSSSQINLSLTTQLSHVTLSPRFWKSLMRVLNAFNKFLSLSQFYSATCSKLMARRCLKHPWDLERSQRENLKIQEIRSSYQMRTSGSGTHTTPSELISRDPLSLSTSTLRHSRSLKEKTSWTLTALSKVSTKVTLPLLPRALRMTWTSTARRKIASAERFPSL